ncbi:uncharacterized protein FPOAC1_014104 [Fusarium poae]|uniref:uncharacterized protein n=1 Tax=Fusarium poae TaxID=36050 RepID=UPI001D05A402|nr:uncharacterized protein FPOAC1_014104 [Fusarium poae]KAG8664080.1 hypothetical protein FPOAC1_014104 [Fusarium poae]
MEARRDRQSIWGMRINASPNTKLGLRVEMTLEQACPPEYWLRRNEFRVLRRAVPKDGLIRRATYAYPRVPPSVPFQPTPIQAPIFTKLNLPTLYPPKPRARLADSNPAQLLGETLEATLQKLLQKEQPRLSTPLI